MVCADKQKILTFLSAGTVNEMEVWVEGANVEGGSQLVRLPTRSRDLTSFFRGLSDALRVTPPSFVVVAACLLDMQTGAAIGEVTSMDQVPHSRCKLRVICKAAQTFASAEGVRPSVVASVRDTAVGLIDALLEGAGVPASERGDFRARCAGLLRDVEELRASPMEAAEVQLEAKRLATRSRSMGAGGGVGPAPQSGSGSVASDFATTRRNKSSRPTKMTPGAVGGGGEGVESASSRPTTPARCPSTTPIVHPAMGQAALQPQGLTTRTDSITLFCVYSGNGGQRAKAFVVERRQPSLDVMLKALESKFKSALSLGYITVDEGAYVEVTSSEQLTQLIASEHGSSDSMTLYCWAKGTKGTDGYDEYREDPGAASSRAPSVAASADTTTPVRAKSARPSSALSQRSGGSRGASHQHQHAASPTVKPMNALDVSGVCYTEEQLRDLFDQLDTDHSGFLDKEEFRRYFLTRFDDMGVGDAAKKFDKMLSGCREMDDGMMTFDEFCVVILRLAQW